MVEIGRLCGTKAVLVRPDASLGREPGDPFRETAKESWAKGGKLPPELTSVSAESHFAEPDEFRLAQRRSAMQDEDVPDYEIEGAVPESGFALWLKKLPTLEKRRRDTVGLTRAERAVAEMVAVTANVDLGMNLPTELPDFTIDYVEETVPREPGAAFTEDVVQWQQGFLSTRYMLRTYADGKLDGLTEEEAIVELAQRRELLASITVAAEARAGTQNREAGEKVQEVKSDRKELPGRTRGD